MKAEDCVSESQVKKWTRKKERKHVLLEEFCTNSLKNGVGRHLTVTVA